MSEFSQLRDYCSYLDEVQGEIDLNDVVPPVRPIDGSPRDLRGHRGWLVAVAAAASILILVGGVAWFSPRGGLAPAVEPTTTAEVTPTTKAAITADTVAATTTTFAAAPIAAPGEGPKLEFVRVELPNDDGWHPRPSTVWFEGALYVGMWGDGEVPLYRTVDGVTWELLPGFPANSEQLETDGVRLVSVAPDVGDGCAGSGAFFEVNTSTNGVDWTPTRIPLPVPEDPNVAGCFEADVGQIAAGPHGIIVTGKLSLEVGAGFGSNLIDPEDGIHVETTVDFDRGVIIAEFFNEPDMEPTGEIVEISLDDAGFTELFSYMESDPGWEPLIEPLLGEISQFQGIISRDVAWYSPDGETWQPLDAAGPLHGARGQTANFAMVATPDGFVAWSHGRVWESTDNGTTWTEGGLLPERPWWMQGPLDVWAGTPISVSDEGVWTIEDTPRELIPATGMGGMNPWVGDFGLFAIRSLMGGEAAADEVIFSQDGATWNRWNPAEIDQEAGGLWMVGIGGDFVVLEQRDRDSNVLLVGTLP